MASTVYNPFTKRLDYVGANINTTQAGTVKRTTVTPAADGSTTVFTTPDAYVPNTLLVFVNGLVEHYFTETTSTTFTFSSPPLTGDDIHVFYATSTGGSAGPDVDNGFLEETGVDLFLLENGDHFIEEGL